MSDPNSGDIRGVANELQNIADAMDRTPISKGAPLLYEEMCIKIYGTPEHYGGGNFYIEHTCRDDLGVVMISDYSPLFDAILSCIGEEEDGDLDRDVVKEWAKARDDVTVELH